jgi:MFS family permease
MIKEQGVGKWGVVGLLWCMYFLNQADRQALFSVFPAVKAQLGLSDTSLGLISSVFFWIYAISVPLAGAFGDVWNRKWTIVAALTLWSTATLLTGLLPGLVLLIVFRGVTAGAEAFYYPSAVSIIADYHGERTRSTALSIHQTSVYIGIVGSGTLAGWFADRHGWSFTFVLFGATGIVIVLLGMKFLREPVRGAADEVRTAKETIELWTRLRETLTVPTTSLLTGAFTCMVLVNAAYLTWTPTLLHRKFGLNLAEAGFHATFWHHAGALVGIMAAGKIADRMAIRSVLSRPWIQFIGLMAGAPFIFLLGISHSKTVAFAALALFGVFRGVYDSNLFASLYEVIRPECRATATGLMIAVAFALGGTAPLLVGWLSSKEPLGQAISSMSLAYVAAALLILVDCLFFFRRDAQHLTAARSSLPALS